MQCLVAVQLQTPLGYAGAYRGQCTTWSNHDFAEGLTVSVTRARVHLFVDALDRNLTDFRTLPTHVKLSALLIYPVCTCWQHKRRQRRSGLRKR